MKKHFLLFTFYFLIFTVSPSQSWHPVTGSGSKKTPIENMSLVAEIFVVHDHVDATANSNWSEGIMINRHIWKGRNIAPPPMITRDSKGENEDPKGAYISLASRPKTQNGYGGELFDKNDGKTAHQRDWDYLAAHVEKAYDLYKTKRLINKGYLGQYAIPEEEESAFSDWEKLLALADYALQWKMKTTKVYESFHPVDVMHHSSFCTGPANILHALTMVAGFESRFIAISNHSMVEIKLGDKWYWFDNNTRLNAYHIGLNNYAEVTTNPDEIIYLNVAQKSYLGTPVARYRSPYHYSGRYYWHFCWGKNDGFGSRKDVKDGFGLTVPYDPSCAAALYPEMEKHAFFVPKNWPAVVNLTEKGSFIKATYPIKKGMQFRKRFFIGETFDNPVKEGKVKLWFHGKAKGDEIECYIDDTKLEFTGKGIRYKKPVLEYTIPASALTSGEHDFIVKSVKKKLYLWFYPDIVEPYFPPSSSKLHLDDKAFFVDPYISAKELEELEEEF